MRDFNFLKRSLHKIPMSIVDRSLNNWNFFFSRFRQAGLDGQWESVRCSAAVLRQEAEEPTGRHDDGRLYCGIHQAQIAQAGHDRGAKKCIPRWRTSLALRYRRGYVDHLGNERKSVPTEGNLRGAGTPFEQLRSDRWNVEVVLHVSRFRSLQNNFLVTAVNKYIL